jgi:hypothetical protein
LSQFCRIYSPPQVLGKQTTTPLHRWLLAFAKETIYGRNGPSTDPTACPRPHNPSAHFGNVPDHFSPKYGRVLYHLGHYVKRVNLIPVQSFCFTSPLQPNLRVQSGTGSPKKTAGEVFLSGGNCFSNALQVIRTRSVARTALRVGSSAAQCRDRTRWKSPGSG